MLKILEKKEYKNEDKIKILKLFEKLNASGGLPESVHKECMKRNPNLKEFLKNNNIPECTVF